MDIFSAFLLGVVEGLTEFLPISSTGHLILASRLLGVGRDGFLTSFEISIQLGAILAVVSLYGKSLWMDRQTQKRILLAFLPTAALGALFYKIVKNFLLQNETIVLWSLFLGGILLIAFEKIHREKPDATENISEISYRQCLWVGLFQSLAMVPGVSRSAATILGGLLIGLKRQTTVEFSFMLAIPTMAAATGFDLLKNARFFSADQLGFLAIGFVTSFAVAFLSIQFLLRFIRNHDFIPFGIYRIALALLFWPLIR